MFGYIGAPCSGCQIGAAKVYRSFFCGLCNRLRGDYGLPARFLVNRDSTFLAIVASARMKEAPCSTESTCCNPLGKKRTHFETGPAVTYAAATTLFGLEMKLRDNAADESGWKRNASTSALSIAARSFDRARNHLQQFDLDTRAIEAKRTRTAIRQGQEHRPGSGHRPDLNCLRSCPGTSSIASWCRSWSAHAATAAIRQASWRSNLSSGCGNRPQEGPRERILQSTILHSATSSRCSSTHSRDSDRICRHRNQTTVDSVQRDHRSADKLAAHHGRQRSGSREDFLLTEKEKTQEEGKRGGLLLSALRLQ